MTDHPRRGGRGSENRPSPRARRRPPAESEFSAEERRYADLIRQTYIDDRSAWESLRRGVDYSYACPASYDKPRPTLRVEGVAVEGGSDRPPLWLELARKFLHRRLDPEEYIHRLFDHRVSGRPPEPAQLLDKKFLARWESTRLAEVNEVADSLEIQKCTAAANIAYWQRAGLNFVDSHAFVLLDDTVPLSALFRMCLAYTLKDRDPVFGRVIFAYLDAAVVQFERSREQYCKAWGDLLPARFVANSRQLYEKAVSQSDLTGGWKNGEEEEGQEARR